MNVDQPNLARHRLEENREANGREALLRGELWDPLIQAENSVCNKVFEEP